MSRSVACLIAVVAILTFAPPASAADTDAGQKVPRFVSLRSDQVNLRVGPGENYPIEWVLTRKEMPVEIVKEFENWRMIRDWQGTEGWVHERMLTGKRAVGTRCGRTAHRMPRRLVPHRLRRPCRLGPARRPLGHLPRRSRAVKHGRCHLPRQRVSPAKLFCNAAMRSSTSADKGPLLAAVAAYSRCSRVE